MSAMHLRRLKVEQLRRFRSPYELDGLTPGLNVIAAPNESGKSTLVHALRAAFFERYRSTSVNDLKPWDDPQASPTIELDFDLDGTLHQLYKRFLSGKKVTLKAGDRLLDGTDAEDHLAERFGFGFAQRGGSKPEHWGIPGLLWVEQGSSQQLAVAQARDHLQAAMQGARRAAPTDAGSAPGDALGAATSELAARQGDALLRHLGQQRAELLTDTGRPRQPLLDARQARDDAQTALHDLDARIAHYRDQVDQLQRLQAQWQADAQSRPWEPLERELAATRERQQQHAEQQRQLRVAQDELEQLGRTRRLIEAELARLADAAQQAIARAQAEETAALRRTQTQAELQQAQARADACSGLLQQARSAARAAAAQAQRWGQRQQQRDRRQRLREQIDQQQALLDSARERWQRAEACAVEARQAHAALAALPRITEAQWQQLERLERAADEQRLALQAVATRLDFDLPTGRSLRLSQDGRTEVLDGQGLRQLDSLVEIDLGDGGRLRIQPGGADIADRQQRADAADQAWRKACAQLSVQGAAEARRAAMALREQQRLTDLADQALALMAPQGPAAVEQAVQDALAVLARLQAELAAEAMSPAAPAPTSASADGQHGAAASPPPDDDLDAEDLAQRLAQAQAEAARCADAQTAAEAEDRVAQQAWADARQRHSVADSQWQAARDEAAQARLRAEAAQQVGQDGQGGSLRDQRLAELERTQAQWALRSEQVARLREALEQARPAFLEQDIQRLSASIQNLHQAHQRQREQVLVLQAELHQAGGQGLEEQRAALAAQAAAAERRLDQLQRRADALDLLVQRLGAHRQSALARLQAPLQQRLAHYLPLVMPGARLSIDEQLAPQQLVRPVGSAPGATLGGPLDAHSYGAREQLALLCRLAYADLLQDAGRPTLIVLDDALTHTDAERLAQMKRALFDAAQRHQVLVFTCHPNLWHDAGVPVRML